MEELKQNRPTVAQLDRELARRSRAGRWGRALRSTLWLLIVVAAAALLCSTTLLSVLQVQGSSMEPTLQAGETLLAVKAPGYRRGDIVAFYYNNKILLKRVVAVAGETVDIRSDGTVLVDGTVLDETYAAAKSLSPCDLTLPYQVPDGRVFVLGDNRAVSLDSRTAAIGCVAEKSILGRVSLRIWPLDRLGTPD